MSDNPNIVTLTNGLAKLTATSDGGSVLTWKNSRKELLYKGSTNRRTGIPVLFPFANPLKNNIFTPTGKEISQHGFGRESEWEIKQVSDSVAELVLNSENIEDKWKEAYPYKFKTTLTLDISHEDTLRYTFSVQNLGDKPLPIAPGIHPYFPADHEDKKHIKITNLKGFNPLKINWDKDLDGMYYDFTGESIITLEKKIHIEIRETSKEKAFDHLVIWSANKTKPDYNFICIEPFTKTSNALNDDPILVAPGETWEKQILFTAL